MNTADNNNKKQYQPGPIKKEDIQKNPDQRIDQDFPGFPHPIAKEEVINPKTPNQKATAGSEKKEDNVISTGSANAFEATEGIEEKPEDEDHDAPPY
ncbi:MAG: hypothetical protein QM731_10155 [Chitinophagaceae bacterium]